MSTNEELLAIRQAATPQGVGTQTQVFADKALNAEVWDVEGRRYIDLASGIAVTNTGHYSYPFAEQAAFAVAKLLQRRKHLEAVGASAGAPR